MFIVRAKCGLTYVVVAALCSSRSLKIISNGDGQLCMKLDDQWVLMFMMGSKIPTVELNTVHCNSIIHYSCTINNITLGVGIIASVCSLPNSQS